MLLSPHYCRALNVAALAIYPDAWRWFSLSRDSPHPQSEGTVPRQAGDGLVADAFRRFEEAVQGSSEVLGKL
jgi:hypothetical protein